MRFSDQIIIVTGAGRGIGRAVAHCFARHGGIVMVTDVKKDRAELVASEIVNQRGNAHPYQLDVTDSRQVETVYRRIAEEFDSIDILIANAGVITVSPIQDMDEADWDNVMNVNAKGVFLTCREAVRYMVKKGKGKIVTVSSIAGKTGIPLTAHYSASKFAVIGFTQALAREVTPAGINVNCVCPGFIDTPMLDELQGKADVAKYPDTVIDSKMGRKASPDEVAELICFLCSKQAEYISGQSINICGLGELH